MELQKKYKLNPFSNKVIILLLVIQAFLSGSNLDQIQIAVEILILGIYTFFFMYYNVKFQKFEIIISLILFIISLISCLINPINIAILNAKVFILAIGSILFFTKFELKPYYIIVVLSINIFFIFYQYLVGSLPFATILNPIVGAFGEYTDSRPLGLFLNTHFSAYVIAIYLIFLGYKKNFYGFGVFILYFTMSKFTLASYIAHLIFKSKIINFLKKYMKKLMILSVIILTYLIIEYSEDIIKFDLGAAYSSFNTIAEQILKTESYISTFSLLPDDTNKIFESFTNDAGNEVMYFTLIFQGGFILFFFYMFFFIQKLKIFKIFVLISMLHYGFSMSPLILYLIIYYNDILIKDKITI